MITATKRPLGARASASIAGRAWWRGSWHCGSFECCSSSEGWRRKPLRAVATLQGLRRDSCRCTWCGNPMPAFRRTDNNATSTTRAPGAWLSSTIRAFASSLQLRRPLGPAITSSRSMRSTPLDNENCTFPCKPVAPNLAKTPAKGNIISAGQPVRGRPHRLP
jgi:hypothetical protein